MALALSPTNQNPSLAFAHFPHSMHDLLRQCDADLGPVDYTVVQLSTLVRYYVGTPIIWYLNRRYFIIAMLRVIGLRRCLVGLRSHSPDSKTSR